MNVRPTSYLLILLIGGTCAKHEPPAVPLVTAAPPTVRQLIAIEVAKVDIFPATIRRDPPVTVTVELKDAPGGTPVTLAWFGPDGWLVTDESAETRGNSVSFAIPAGAFPSPGRYIADLRAGVVHLGGGEITVTQ
jgi:hypothetical protein